MVPVLGILSRNAGTLELTLVRDSARVGLGLFQHRGRKKTHWKRKSDSTFSGSSGLLSPRRYGRRPGAGPGGRAKKEEEGEGLRILVSFITTRPPPGNVFVVMF